MVTSKNSCILNPVKFVKETVKIVQESRLIKENSRPLVQVRRASSTVGDQCGRVVSWLENEDLPQCHTGGERIEIWNLLKRGIWSILQHRDAFCDTC